MACSGCTKQFGFFDKELGCPECGFSFCKKCLKYQSKDPNEDVTRNVCAKCHLKHVQMEPPLDAVDEYSQKFRRCIETMCESDKKVKINFVDQKERFSSVKEGFDYETQKLQARLEALEEDYKKTKPKLKTEEELSEWLDKIEDRPSSSKRLSVAYRPPDNRTQTECADQLLKQYMEEVALDDQVPKPELELEERLARLRGEGACKASPEQEDEEIPGRKSLQRSPEVESLTSSKKPTKGIWGLDLPKSEYSEDGDEAAAQAIVKKALLDAEMEQLNVEEEEDEDLEDLDPNKWCVVCNENATVKCLNCDGDLYCDACFTECCQREEHSSEPYINECKDTQ